MQVYEITGYKDGVNNEGVNYLQAKDAFENLKNGFVYRQVLQSRLGINLFTPRLSGNTRVYGIFEYILPNTTRELLAFDANFLYKYNTGTNEFDLIPFGGSMAAYAGFGIAAPEYYISGTAYPAKDNTPRFVFSGEGIVPNANNSSIFFYDGTNVLDFTDVGDNPDYAPPPQGNLEKTTYVVYFNERLNFILPTIAAQPYGQGVLYSGIRDSSGNGDKFNVPGSGLFQADTAQDITGASILGQILVLNFTRMAYVLEKTRDAFNPYFGRGIPGVLGTNAKFSAVAWNDTINSMGKTGVLGTDGRQNLRVDNKVPYFTQDQIEQVEFDMTYGGFDRVNNQFLWSYVSSGSDSDTQNGILVRNYEEGTWSVFDLRVTVFGQTDLGPSLTWDDIEESEEHPTWDQWDTTEEIWNRIGLEAEVQKTLAGDDLGFIYNLNQDYDDYVTGITGAVAGATTMLTVNQTAFKAGDLVVVDNVVGLDGINNYDTANNNTDFVPYQVISATDTQVEITFPSAGLPPYVSGGKLAKPINFEATMIPFNPWRSEGKRVFLSHIECLIDNNGGSLRVDVYADEQETPFKQDVLLRPNSDLVQARQWITMSVNQEANFITFVLKQQSAGAQLRISSIRIHCMPGGLTSNG